MVGGSLVVGLLGGDAGAGEVAVQEPSGDAVADDGAGGGCSDPVGAAFGVVGGVQHPAGGDLGLVERRHRLRLHRQLGQHPRELGRVHPGHRHGGHPDVGVVVAQLGEQGLVEPPHGVLGAAVRRLQRDAAVGQRGTDLDDDPAVARAACASARCGCR